MKTLLFVDDEPRVLQGLQRQLRPMYREWDMSFVESGKAALQFMETHAVDIVVSDMMMPEMDGSQLLAEVAKRHPQTVRIILSGHAEREAMLRLVGPAHQYLSKPCCATELREAIGRAFALRDLLGNEQLKRLTTRVENLPTLPSLHNELTAELNQDSPSLEKLGEIISRDIGMTAKILQLVNSAFFGLAHPVNTTTEAVTYLGLSTIRSLVFSMAIFAQYNQEACASFSLEKVEQHSWLTGTMARSLAQKERQPVKLSDQCYLAGLLHDVGQLVLAFGLPRDYEQVMTRAKDEQKPVWQVEYELFGTTHSDVGAYLLSLWGLPNLIVEAVAFHHEPARSTALEFSPVIAVHAADVFAHQRSQWVTGAPPQLDMEYLTRLGYADRVETWQELCGQMETL